MTKISDQTHEHETADYKRTHRPAAKAKKPTGRVNVYILHNTGFFGRLRPCHDSAADAIGELTDDEASELRTVITRYIEKCHKRHGCEQLGEAIARGQCS